MISSNPTAVRLKTGQFPSTSTQEAGSSEPAVLAAETDTRRVTVTQFTRKPDHGSFSIERVFADVRRQLPPSIAARVVVNAHLSQGLLPRLHDAWRARRYAADVNHVTGDVHYLTYLLPRNRTILTIHDTVVLERKRGLRRFLLWFLWYWLPIRRCARVVAISEETKRRILRHVRCDPEKIVVVHNPVSDSFSPLSYPALDGRFRLLHIGTKPNKNLERLIEAVDGLPVTLVVVGRLTEAQRRRLEASGIQFENHVGLTDDDLKGQYAAAHALAFVSTAEGFGLPIVEAQATGRPVITSARAPMDEVAGDAALFVDPESVQDIRRACEEILEDPDLREHLVAAGAKNVARFQASRVAADYAAIYSRVLHEAESRTLSGISWPQT